MKHTPGPWRYVKSDAVYDSDDYQICDFGSCSTEEGHANARLIAAAPELLECVIDLLDLALSIPEGWKETQKAIALLERIRNDK